MAAALQVRSARADLLAANVANADTPGYQARDIDFSAALDSVLDNQHPTATSTRAAALANLRYDGNDVDVNQALATAYANSLDYVATLKLYGDSLQRVTTASSGS